MFRFLRTFALFFVAFLSFDGGAFAGSFTCNSAKTYVSCDAGYYLSDCGSYRDGRAIASPAAGNSCRACPAATSSAYYECAGSAVCPKNMVENEFTVKTTSLAANTVFSFKISAAGVFYVKWGDSSVVEKIDRTNNTAETSYSHTYTTSGVKTITISGQATAYTTSVSIPAINFYNNKNIASISGSLGAVFGTLSDGTQPRFFQSFYGATNLAGTIPSTLFNGITGTPASHMFAGTFQNCSKLTSIGTGLFSGLSGSAAASLFQSTFNGCTGLTSIPENLFGNIPSTATLASYSFRNMFNGCTNLSGPSAKINGEFIYDIWSSATAAQVGGMYTGATGLADWPCIPTNYGGESNGCIYISYNANGGSGTAPTSPTYCIRGGTCVLPENTFTRTGYNFSNWTASVDGSNLMQYFAPGTDIFSGYSGSDLKGWKSVELTANWSVKCNKITLNNTTNGGSGGTTTIYKKTGSTTYYSDSSCMMVITSVTVPSKANASYLGHYLTSTNSANTGTRCISSTGVLSTSTSCNVSADTTWYAHYQCADGWTDSGEYATGVCGKNITITLDNAFATTDGTDILYGRTGISYPFLDSAFTRRLTPTANPITIPVNQSVFTFNTNGGRVDLSGSTFSPSATVSGNVATFAPSTFMGYYSAASGGTQFVDGRGYITSAGVQAVASATGDLTWYAQWDPSVLTITGVPGAVREGFYSVSWTVEFDNRGHVMTTTAQVGQRVSLPASATFTANYTPITYAVTLDTQGGTGGTSGVYYQFQTPGQCMYYSSADLSACTDGASGITLTIPTRTGYTFDGYYTAENGGGVMYVDALGTISPDLLAVPENSTLYAKWTPNCNQVYLNPTSGTAGALSALYKITDFPDIWFTDPNCSVRITQDTFEALVPTRSGYTFRGFYAIEDSAEFESDIVKDYATTVPYLLAYGYASPIWNINGRTSLYASWVKDCEVPANGSCSMSIGPDGLTVDYTTSCSAGYTLGNADTATPTCTANTYTCSAGQYLNGDGCETCMAGSYCTGGSYTYNGQIQGQSDCPSGHGNSDVGSDSESDCYRACTASDVSNATTVSGRVYSDGRNACDATGCASGYSVQPGSGIDLNSTIGTVAGDSRNYNASTMTFSVDYGDLGSITGRAQCSSQSGIGIWNGASTSEQVTTSATLLDSTGGYCYCTLDGYTPSGGSAQSLSGPWVFFDGYDDAGNCADYCALDCANLLQDNDTHNLVFRPAVFRSHSSFATCAANTYTVSYAANGGSGSAPTAPTSCTYGSDCAAPANTYTRTGYTFAGWKCTGGTTACDGDIIAAGGSLKNVSTGSAITLTAQWNANTYTVSYAANGGSGSAPTAPTSCTYGSDCAAPANTYTRTGYTFAGWKCTGGTTACDGDIIAAGGSLKNVSTGSAITLTAQWNANCNAVTLNANGGTQGSVKTLYKKTGSGTWYANSNCTTAYTTTANIVPTRTGYTFRGFYVEDLDDVSSDNSSNTRYFSTDGTAADSSKSWLITGASTLYAAWARNCTVPVGGTCSLEIKTYGYVDYTTSCSAGYTLGNADTSTPTCTAKTYTVSFNANGGTGGQSASVTATYAAAMPAISTTAPTRAGYTFVGWYDNADYAAGVQYYTAAGASARNWNKTENATLYAGWTINGYDCKAGEYLNVTACKVCESGYYCPSTAVSYSYNGQIQGRTACSNKPENAVYTSATGNTSSSCPWTCNAGYYGTSANGNTSCAVCGTGNYCTGGLNKTACSTTYANTTTTTTTATSSSACVCAAGYGGTSASSCTACAKGYYKASAGTVACTIADKNNYVAITGATKQTACTTLGSFYTTTDSTGSDAASDCYGTTTAGKYIATANSSTQTGCTNGNYCPATTVYYGKSGTNGGGLNVCAVPYSRSAAGSDDENDCYLITSATKYVKEVGAGEVDCPAGKYCAGGSTVYKGGTVSGRNTTGGSATCPAGSYCSEGVSEPTACSTLGGGLYKDSAEGSSAPADCYVITTGGYYVANATDEAQTKCEAKYYCPAVILGYPSVGGRESCPDPASSTYKEAVSEIDWLTARCPDATTSNSSVTSSSYQTFSNTGLSAITQCPAIMTVSTPCSNFSVESARYNSTTGRYDSDKGSVYARSVKAGYYLTERYSSTYCTTNGQPNTNRMLYKKAVKCPENSYCPGGTVPVCNTGTYEESWGANACTTLGDFYTTSAEGATTNTACYGITTAGKYIATAKADETTCAAGGYCPGSVKVNYNSTGGRTPCAAGKYNASTGSSAASACVACAIGSYAVDTGNTACTACAAGTTTTATGHTSATCSACANNNDYDNSWATPSWSANKVTNLCKISNCKAGSKYSSAAGTNTTGSCTACAAGTYQATNGSTATSCSAISAGCYGGAGATTECPNVCADNKYSDAGASSCTACPTDYKNSGTTVASHAGVASCKITVSDGYYIGTAGDNSSNWDKCAAGTAKAAHTVAYGSMSSCDTCANWSYSAAGAASCTSCPALTSGWSKVDSTGTGWTTYTSCKQSQKPANCSSGGITQTATSSTQWGASSVTTALKANANYYVNGTACSACSGLASGFYPNSTAGNSGGASACYTNSLSGKYVASTNATSATNCAAGTAKAAHTVAYGSTSSCDVCGANQYSDAGAGACSACATDKGYSNSGTTATDHAGAASCKTTCMAGTMVATANAACSTPNNTAYGASWYTAEHIVAYGSTSKSLSKVSSCPTSYATVNNETATSHDAKSDCTITCAAGKVVADIDAACTTPSGSWYSAQHTVSAGGTSGTNKKSCLTNYATPSTTTQTDHDNSNDCAISCPAGTQIATANATTCTTPSGNWYVGANTVKQGSVSTVNTCAVGENLFNADDYGIYWGYFNATNAVGLTAFENNAVVFVPVEGNTIYQISGMRGKGSMFVGTTTSEPATGVQVSGFVDAGAVDKGFVYRTPVDAKYLLVLALRSVDGSTTATRQAILDKNVANLQIFKANSGYGIVGNTATEHDTVSDCMIYCGAGEYVATAGGVCENVGAGYYGTGGIVPQGSISANRGQCVAPLTTIGYGFGANEADDCGRKLHAGSEVIYLRSAPRTSPALNVRVGDDIFYGAMSTALSGKLKVKDVDNTTYSVVNDYQ